MTTLTAPDITTTGTSPLYRRSIPGGGLEYFSHGPALSETGDRWTEWLREIIANPASVEDDLVTAPSQLALSRAIDFLAQMNQIGAPAPDVVSFGPNGEIVFERRRGEIAEQVVIFDDLRVDHILYRHGRLTDRRVIAEPEPATGW